MQFEPHYKIKQKYVCRKKLKLAKTNGVALKEML